MAKVKPVRLTDDMIYEKEAAAAQAAFVVEGNDELMRQLYEKYDTEEWKGDYQDRRRTFFQTVINERQPMVIRKAAFRKLRAISPEIAYFSRFPEMITLLSSE